MDVSLDCSFNQKPKTEIIICASHKYVDILGYFQLGRSDFGFSSEQTNFKASTSERRRMRMHNKLRVYPDEVGCRGFVASSIMKLPEICIPLTSDTVFPATLKIVACLMCVHTNF